MRLKEQAEITLLSKAGKKFLFDFRYPINRTNKPIILFVHGFKGFKDWGHFNMMADWFCEKGFCFIKMNFSHNGTTPKNPTEFIDLEAFGNNNFSKELLDIDTVLDFIFSKESKIDLNEIDLGNITLMGHSKGGATTLIKSFEDPRITRCATLAAVLDIKTRYAEQNAVTWKKNGVIHVYNGRTDQYLPVYYQLAEDILANETRFNIPIILKNLNKPTVIIHPKNDETVPLKELNIASNANNSLIQIHEIEGNHTFDGFHPYNACGLPESSIHAFKLVVNFITK